MKKFLWFIIPAIGFCLFPTLAFAGTGTIYNSGYGQSAGWSSTATSVSVSNVSNQWGPISGYFNIPGLSSQVHVYGGIYWYTPPANFPYVLASNLTPNHYYQIYCSYISWTINSETDGSAYDIYQTAITDCLPTPAPVYSNIKHDRISIIIDRGANALTYPIVYKVYQGTSSAGPWTLVHEDTSFAQNYSFIKTGLVEDTTYYYYIEATGGSGIAAVSPKSSVMTTADPTLAAVEAAKGAAETASQQASAVKNIVDVMHLELTAIRNTVNELKMGDDQAPEIIDVHFPNRKSLTTLEKETVYVVASDEKTPCEDLQVRAITNNMAGEWELNSGSIAVDLTQLLNTVIIQVRDGSGKITSSKPLMIWKR
jgi:hypothetical protein